MIYSTLLIKTDLKKKKSESFTLLILPYSLNDATNIVTPLYHHC